jgi:hypothetical protein
VKKREAGKGGVGSRIIVLLFLVSKSFASWQSKGVFNQSS